MTNLGQAVLADQYKMTPACNGKLCSYQNLMHYGSDANTFFSVPGKIRQAYLRLHFTQPAFVSRAKHASPWWQSAGKRSILPPPKDSYDAVTADGLIPYSQPMPKTWREREPHTAQHRGCLYSDQVYSIPLKSINVKSNCVHIRWSMTSMAHELPMFPACSVLGVFSGGGRPLWQGQSQGRDRGYLVSCTTECIQPKCVFRI